MIKAIFFDLDGTLLPMDQDLFVQAYLEAMVKKMAAYQYDPQRLLKSIWAGTSAMVMNNTSSLNEEIFWKSCSGVYGKDLRQDEGIFLEFYEKEFQLLKDVCGFDKRASETIHALQQQGFTLVLATNPLFPAVATYSRIRWTGGDGLRCRYIVLGLWGGGVVCQRLLHCRHSLPFPNF